MYDIIDKLEREHRLDKDGFTTLLSNINLQVLTELTSRANRCAVERFGRNIFVRGLIEISNICRNDCLYCGIRRSNKNLERYRLTPQQIIDCCEQGHNAGFRTFVLQGGENTILSREQICHLVSDIKNRFPDSAVTLSLGEWEYDDYAAFRAAGADRYLLRHESATEEHYARLHPAEMSWSHRMESLRQLRKLGFQTGCGMMIGSPFQTIEHLANDLMFIQEFKPQMIGVGPFIAQSETPFAEYPNGSIDQTLAVVAICRLLHPDALIPSTTALGSIAAEGRTRGILAGANVVMPNLSPEDVRSKYAIYDHKLASHAEAVEGLKLLAEQLAEIGYKISFERGDYSSKH
ncbi:MAG: [FeFe] hydrogenase H-cluster radical SAM maturase HydE [Rikenellaceae bacterium]|nr:[FeFe] hydrogenase H-cluster radical SAM maturase HydE [Rikenellaceae bacterium]